MRNRFFTLLLCIPTVLSPACVQVEDDPAELASEDELAFHAASELTAESDATANGPLAAAIAAHPAYASLSTFAWQRSADHLASYAALDADAATEEVERLEYCQTQPNTFSCYDQLSSVSVSFEISNGLRTSGQTLVTAFGLASMSPDDRVALFLAAQQAYVAAGGPGGSTSMIPSSLGGRGCNASCKADALAELKIVQAGWVTAASMSTDNGGEGAAIAVVIGAVVAILSEIVKDWIDCLLDPDCDTWPETSGYDECNDDADCDPDGWCRKGPLGFGDNECRDKRENGDACSRDAKCESDCCKFSLWDLGSTCRPANECN